MRYTQNQVVTLDIKPNYEKIKIGKEKMSHKTTDGTIIALAIDILVSEKTGKKITQTFIASKIGTSSAAVGQIRKREIRNVKNEVLIKFKRAFPDAFKAAKDQIEKQETDLDFLNVLPDNIHKSEYPDFISFLEDLFKETFNTRSTKTGRKLYTNANNKKKWETDRDFYARMGTSYQNVHTWSKSGIKVRIRKEILINFASRNDYIKNSIRDYLENNPELFRTEKSINEKIEDIHNLAKSQYEITRNLNIQLIISYEELRLITEMALKTTDKKERKELEERVKQISKDVEKINKILNP